MWSSFIKLGSLTVKEQTVYYCFEKGYTELRGRNASAFSWAVSSSKSEHQMGLSRQVSGCYHVLKRTSRIS